MRTDKRDILAVLKTELSYLESGGYSQEAHNAWRPSLVFEDSPSCLNYHETSHRRPCSDCKLTELVPESHRNESRSCRYIPLNDLGQTVDDFYRGGTQRELEWNLMVWLRKTIARMEAERGKLGARNRTAEVEGKVNRPSAG